MKLIIVESPHKAQTIQGFLKKGYKVLASNGHVRDLPENNFGVDLKDNFTPKYVVSAKAKDTIKKLKTATKEADFVYLATDPDREGEAISWHLAHILGVKTNELNRIEFHEITKNAVEKAIENPRTVDLKLVDAQQARRVLDRIVGYKLSPIICKKIQPKLSAGRVQSVALRLIVEREKEINAFKPQEYWTISAYLISDSDKKLVFKATLEKKNGKKFSPSNEQEALEVINSANSNPFIIKNVKRSVTKSHAPAPFTTSTLQQDCSNKLNLSSNITMRLAQNLYEGVELKKEGHIALVTYIRTDSVRVSSEAIDMARGYIAKNYGEEFLPEKPNFYKNKGNNSQDAHEAIRPIDISRTPQSLEGVLERNQLRVYKLIYERFLASQMNEAKYDSIVAEINSGDYTFKTTGKTLLFKGYLSAYTAYKDDSEKEQEKAESAKLPSLQDGEKLNLEKIEKEQKFTKPPARYTDATLIKILEDKGIGRPSTYATILETLKKRAYTVKEGKAIMPTEVAFSVTDFLIANFDNVINTDFTANIESKFDEIEEGTKIWQDVVGEFFQPFNEKLKIASTEVVVQTDIPCPNCGKMLLQREGRFGQYLACEDKTCNYKKSLNERESDEVCEKCGSKMIIKKGRYGEYLACSNYPDCQNIKSLKQKETEETDEICEKCGSKMVVKNGRYGKFIACSNYPACKNIKSNKEPPKIVGKCPDCGGDLQEKKTRFGKVFYGCVNYPKCKFASWDKIVQGKVCPKCKKHLIEKVGKDGSTKIKCSSEECDYIEE